MKHSLDETRRFANEFCSNMKVDEVYHNAMDLKCDGLKNKEKSGMR